ncbi:MAG: dihydropyrimidinase [Anaerolineae bacterium]
MTDTLIKNATLITSEATFRADLAIEGETIAAIGTDLHRPGAQIIDATGKFLIPGAVDIHVHMQMPLPSGVVSSDDFYTGTRAAAHGGTTTIVDFVAPEPEQPMLEAIAARRAEADPRVVVDYALHMTLSPHELTKLAEMPAVVAAGCTTFKLYMAYGFRLRDDELLRALEAVRDVGGLPVVHAENWDVITMLVQRHLAAGHTSPAWHPRSRPARLEAEAASRLIDLAEYAGVPVHIFHIGCKEVIERVAAARVRGLPVTGETCPQYFMLTDDVYETSTLPICSPPIRGAADQAAIWHALAHDQLQLISTDHCPFTRAEKDQPNFSLVPGGVPSIEARLALAYTYGVRAGHLTPNQWVNLCCTAPARLMGLARKGHLAPGYDADLVIFDPHTARTLSTDTLHENVDWTPYEGMTVQGWPSHVFSRGQMVVDDGAFTGAAGHGRYIHRRPDPNA